MYAYTYACTYVFPLQHPLGLAHATGTHWWSSGYDVFKTGGVAMEVRPWPPKEALSLQNHPDHLLGLPANSSCLWSWNTELTLLVLCPWTHLFLTQFFLYAPAPLEYFSSVWPQLCPIFGFTIYYLELRPQRFALLGHQFRLLFHIVI